MATAVAPATVAVATAEISTQEINISFCLGSRAGIIVLIVRKWTNIENQLKTLWTQFKTVENQLNVLKNNSSRFAYPHQPNPSNKLSNV